MSRRIGISGLVLPVSVAAIFLAAFALPVQAQDMQNLLNRLSRMERDMQDLQRQLYRGSGPATSTGSGITSTPVTQAPLGAAGSSAAPAGAGGTLDSGYAARVEVRLQQLETLFRSLTGKIEEIEFKTEQTAGRLDRLVRDIDFRLQSLESGAPAGAAAQQLPGQPQAATETPQAGAGQGVFGYLKESEIKKLDAEGADAVASVAPAEKPAPAAVASAPAEEKILPDGTPEEQYKHAFAYLQKQDFDAAEQALKAFLELHPKNPLAGNAVYWLGETYYVRKDFPQAAKTFASGYTEYPGSSKSADNLLKLGLSLARMDRKEDACVTFGQLATEFPNASANVKRRADAEKKKLGC